MKKSNRKISACIISIYIGSILLSKNVSASGPYLAETKPLSVNVIQITENVQSSHLITPFSDVIGWRYKTVNGKVYKRQYNYSKERWIGEWEPC